MNRNEPLSYASVQQRKRVPVSVCKAAGYAGIAAPSGGLLILISYWLTNWEPIAVAGFYWILLGGGLAATALFAAFIGWLLDAQKQDDDCGRWLGLALWFGLLSIPTFFFCVIVGARLMERTVVVIIDNQTARTIETITLHSTITSDTYHGFPPKRMRTIKTRESTIDVDFAVITLEGRTVTVPVGGYADSDDPELEIDITEDLLKKGVPYAP